MRKLATIRTIDDIQPIDGADKIEVATVGGWKVVVKKGEFKVGESAIYFEIDSWIPIELAPFLSKGKEPREFNGVKGERLRSIKLKKQISQGLLLPLEIDVMGRFVLHTSDEESTGGSYIFTDSDILDEFLNIQKWEKPMNAQLAGVCRGNFPSDIRKTDQERCCDGNTILETEDGFKTIQEICDVKYSGKIKSYNHLTQEIEFKTICDWSVMTRKLNSWIHIKTKSGKEIIVTKTHKIFLENQNCYREAQHLKIGDMLRIT